MKIDVKHTAKLANLPLEEKEIKKFEKQLSDVLVHIDKLSELVTDKIPETNQVTGLINITRSDEITESISQKEAIINSKNSHNGAFIVPAVIEEEV